MTATTYDRSWHLLSDDDLAHYLASYRRRRERWFAELDPEYMEESLAFLDQLIADGAAEEARRAACGLAPLPPRFSEVFIRDLKRRVALDQLCEHELGARLGKLTGGTRRGPCPICRAGERSGSAPFVVYLADPDDQHYTCHACHAGGDAINAIRQAYGESFPQAVERLCAHGGIPVPPAPKPNLPAVAANVTALRRPWCRDYSTLGRD